MSPGTLGLPVQYEGYTRPKPVWESTGGLDAFEPKLSLVPLIFGTSRPPSTSCSSRCRRRCWRRSTSPSPVRPDSRGIAPGFAVIPVIFTIAEDGLSAVPPSLADASRALAPQLDRPAPGGAGGQQQRPCIARVLAGEPEILLLDEPASALDPISTATIEETPLGFEERCSIVIVTHTLQ